MKIKFNPNQIKRSPAAAFDVFKSKITRNLNNKEEIPQKAFYAELGTIGDAFVAQNNLQTMNNKSNQFAEFLVSKGCNNLAGIVYSFLIKINKNNPEEVEKLATKALAIAKRHHDPVHIMARANDLRNIYKKTEPGSDRLLKILYTEKRALVDICNNYNGSKNRFHTGETEMKPVEKYEILLGMVKLDIAQIIKKQNRTEALTEITEAYELLKKHNIKKFLSDAKNLLTELQSGK